MKQNLTIQKPISPFRLTLTVILLVSLLYPVFFAYIDKTFSVRIISRELLFTVVRLTGIALLIHGTILLNNYVFKNFKPVGLRYVVEIILILFLTYWFLFGFVKYIEQPLVNGNPADPNLWTFRRYIGLYMLGTIFIYTFLSGLNIYQVARQKEAQAEQLEREFAQVRLQALKSQVNPHFLFNSLSVLSSLVHVNAELSDQFIQHLAKAYRYILEQKEAELVSLDEELGFLDAYFFLLQIRFDQKIRLEKTIAAGTGDLLLPPLTLQLLVENAVKHNRMSAQEPLVINVSAAGNTLQVENNIQQREQAESSTGIGLENIRKRYAMLTDRKPTVHHTDRFRVQVPLLKPKR
ncbi:sensor histidine kinase [Flavisolibacter nicotianae]|uniref:sensor histidine kinase n=1 Tax=Flavisolibacter nicotianae TaxID=2364882 RepID=UPI000EB0B484|nr:sensor histidine kinase [Flavisolibacter nicotianae]